MAKRMTAPAKEPVDKNLPDKATLAKHAAEYGALDSKSAELRGQMGALVKAGELDRNIHRAASKLAMKLQKMDDSKRSEFLRHFDHYRDLLTLDQQSDLFDGKTPEVPAAKSIGKARASDGAAKPKAAKAAKPAGEKKPRVAKKTPPKPAAEPIAAKDAPTIGGEATNLTGVGQPAAFN